MSWKCLQTQPAVAKLRNPQNQSSVRNETVALCVFILEILEYLDNWITHRATYHYYIKIPSTILNKLRTEDVIFNVTWWNYYGYVKIYIPWPRRVVISYTSLLDINYSKAQDSNPRRFLFWGWGGVHCVEYVELSVWYLHFQWRILVLSIESIESAWKLDGWTQVIQVKILDRLKP